MEAKWRFRGKWTLRGAPRITLTMDQFAPWIATAATIIAACFTASNLGSRITGIGFIIFTIGSIAWFATGLLTGQPALVWTNAVMTLLNLFGVYRWLGRQAKLEEGASKAAKASHAAPGEDLFPASSLTASRLVGRDGDVRHGVVRPGGELEGLLPVPVEGAVGRPVRFE